METCQPRSRVCWLDVPCDVLAMALWRRARQSQPFRTMRRELASCNLPTRNGREGTVRLYAWNTAVSVAFYGLLQGQLRCPPRPGHDHARALRGVADGLIAVACAMLKSQTTFDPSHGRSTPAA